MSYRKVFKESYKTINIKVNAKEDIPKENRPSKNYTQRKEIQEVSSASLCSVEQSTHYSLSQNLLEISQILSNLSDALSAFCDSESSLEIFKDHFRYWAIGHTAISHIQLLVIY